MAEPLQSYVDNQLLAALSAEDFALLQPLLEPVDYELHQLLFGNITWLIVPPARTRGCPEPPSRELAG
jgi:hypothetical protein